jgi:hypothetical protein
MRRTPNSANVAISAAARLLEQHLSLPARRTHSPVEVSRAPRIANLTPAVLRILAKAVAIAWPRASNDSGTHIEEIVEGACLVGAAQDVDAPAAAASHRGCRHRGPKDCFALHRRRRSRGAPRKLAVHHHPVLAQPVKLGQMLELDGARRFAIPAGRACPQGLVADYGRDERRQRVFNFASDQRVALLQQVVLEVVEDPFERQRLAGQESGACVLAPSAHGTRERVEAFLPGEIADAARADVRLLGRHHLRDRPWARIRGRLRRKRAPGARSRYGSARPTAESPGTEDEQQLQPE